jgi:1-pyrroline-5-carboxylate dehydrogenase
MLDQSETVQQAEIDAACELADFWRFYVPFARQVLAEQPAADNPGDVPPSSYRYPYMG